MQDRRTLKKLQQVNENKKLVSKALILAAGDGMRLVPPVPKPVYKLLGVPLLARTLLTLEEAGISDAYIVLGYEEDRVKSAIREIDGFKIRLHWLKNDRWEEPNGLSVLAAEDILQEPFILCMSDHLFDPLIVAKLRERKENPAGVILAVDYDLDRIFDLEDATKVKVEDGAIKQINKSIDGFNAVDTGFFLASPRIFGAVREAYREGRPSLSNAVQKLADQGSAKVMDIRGLMWADIDTLEDAKHGADKLMATLGRPEDGLVSRYLNRPISKWISRRLVKTSLSANAVTALNMILGIIGGVIAAVGGYWPFLICALLFQLNSIIDGTDGEIARLKFQKSPGGQWWDTIADNIVYLFVLSGLTIGVKRASLPEIFFIFGILASVSTFAVIVSLFTYMAKTKKSGSVLSVKYGYEKWNNWLSRLIYVIGKRDMWAFALLILAAFGKSQFGLVFIGLFAVGLFLASLRVNLQLAKSRRDRNKRAPSPLS